MSRFHEFFKKFIIVDVAFEIRVCRSFSNFKDQPTSPSPSLFRRLESACGLSQKSVKHAMMKLASKVTTKQQKLYSCNITERGRGERSTGIQGDVVVVQRGFGMDGIIGAWE